MIIQHLKTETEQETPPHTIQLVRSGRPYFSLLEMLINKARHSIHLQTYIFEEDDTGKPVLNALINAANRGVKVSLVLDGYASQGFSRHTVAQLNKAGIRFHFFSPTLKSKHFYFGRRLHHKVVVVDSEQALVGGINISNHYNDTVEQRAWLDYALFVKGPIAQELEKICEDIRRFEIRQSLKNRVQRKRLLPEKSVPITVRVNDWVRGKKEITLTYLRMLRNAQSHITIMSSYMLPGKVLLYNLRKAADRGVKIRLIMAGMSDVWLAKYAERFMYRWLLTKNIEIYEYQPNVLHAKMAICDSEWLTIGSYNVNNISAYASIELNLVVYNPAFAKQTEEHLETIINDCRKITKEELKRSTLLQRLLQRSAYDIFRILLYLFTFYFKQRE
jgi:cardiolipin synthase